MCERISPLARSARRPPACRGGRLAPLLPERMADTAGSLLLVVSPMGEPWLYRKFPRAWDSDRSRAQRRGARERKSAVRAALAERHRQRRDLRWTGIVPLAEARATTPQIAALSGHSVKHCQRIIDTYLPRLTEVALGARPGKRLTGTSMMSGCARVKAVVMLLRPWRVRPPA